MSEASPQASKLGRKRVAQRKDTAQGARAAATAAIIKKWAVRELVDIFPIGIRPQNSLGDTCIRNLRTMSLNATLAEAQSLMVAECVDKSGNPINFCYKHSVNIAKLFKSDSASKDTEEDTEEDTDVDNPEPTEQKASAKGVTSKRNNGKKAAANSADSAKESINPKPAMKASAKAVRKEVTPEETPEEVAPMNITTTNVAKAIKATKTTKKRKATTEPMTFLTNPLTLTYQTDNINPIDAHTDKVMILTMPDKLRKLVGGIGHSIRANTVVANAADAHVRVGENSNDDSDANDDNNVDKMGGKMGGIETDSEVEKMKKGGNKTVTEPTSRVGDAVAESFDNLLGAVHKFEMELKKAYGGVDGTEGNEGTEGTEGTN